MVAYVYDGFVEHQLGCTSLDKDCPHSVRAIMFFIRTFKGCKRPLAHLITGLSRDFLLELIRSSDRSMYLTQIVQILATLGLNIFQIFLKLHNHLVFFTVTLKHCLGSSHPNKQHS